MFVLCYVLIHLLRTTRMNLAVKWSIQAASDLVEDNYKGYDLKKGDLKIMVGQVTQTTHFFGVALFVILSTSLTTIEQCQCNNQW